MSGTSSVPLPTIGPNGVIVPQDSEILAGVQADINASFGGGLNPALETPQGQLASTISAIVSDKDDQFMLLANLMDPAYTFGRFQDGIARIYFLTRIPARPTVVVATCVGKVGVPIPAGTTAQALDNNIYVCTDGGTIPISGSLDLTWQCTATGPIACPPGNLNKPYLTIPGWDTISNASDGVIGRLVESSAEFEDRRSSSVAINARGSLASIKAAVMQLPNVLDVYATENPLNTSTVIGGYSMAPNSLYVAVSGGDPLAIATAIWSKKAPGANYNGNTSQVVLDTDGYSIPYPSYTVKFNRPTSTPIKFAVALLSSSAIPSNAGTLIQAAIISAFAGADGGTRAKIGGKILASRFYGGIAALGPWAQIVNIHIGTASPTLDAVTMNIDQQPTVSSTDITVTLV